MSVEARFPERLLDEAKALVKEGPFQDLESVLQEALRRYLDAHRSELLDRFVREDIAWGLGGDRSSPHIRPALIAEAVQALRDPDQGER